MQIIPQTMILYAQNVSIDVAEVLIFNSEVHLIKIKADVYYSVTIRNIMFYGVWC